MYCAALFHQSHKNINMSAPGATYSQRSLRWCRLIEIPSTHQPTALAAAQPGDTDVIQLVAPSPLFLYVQCWQRSALVANNDCGDVKQPPQLPDVKVEAQQQQGGADGGPASNTASHRSLLRDLTLTAHLYHPGIGAVWKTDVGSLAELRPPYMADDASFLAVFESIFGSSSSSRQPEVVGMRLPSTSFSVFPVHLAPTTHIVRVDVRMSARGGHASVAICALHCSNVTTTIESDGGDRVGVHAAETCQTISNLWGLIARDVDRLGALQAASDAALAAAAATEQRMVELARQHQQDCDSLLSGFVEVLNQKKAKIRELTTEGDALRRRMATLEEAFGSGGASDVEEIPPHSDGGGPPLNIEDADDDVQWVDPMRQPAPHGTTGPEVVATANNRKRSRSSNASRDDLQPSKSRGELSANSLDNLLDM